eukprot:COSAG02_NODE_3991_length_5942_cov_5.521308_5_plen_395_part_00
MTSTWVLLEYHSSPAARRVGVDLVVPAHLTHATRPPAAARPRVELFAPPRRRSPTMLLPALLGLLLPVQLPVPGVTYMPMMPGSHGKPGLVTLGVRPRSICTLVRVSVASRLLLITRRSVLWLVLWLVLWAQNLTVAFSDWRLRRSLDGGRSFGPVVDLPNRSEARCLANEDGVMIGDERTQTLYYVVACDDLASSGGRSPDLQVLNSTDGGLTWATPAVNITATTRLSPLRGGAPTSREAYLPAIGGGIQTKSGRLVAQMYGKWCFNDPTGGCNTSGAFSRHGESPNSWAEINHVLYSDDGQTWHTSDVFGVYGAEGSVVELFDGRLLFNYRVDGPMTDHCPDNARVCDTGWGGQHHDGLRYAINSWSASSAPLPRGNVLQQWRRDLGRWPRW